MASSVDLETREVEWTALQSTLSEKLASSNVYCKPLLVSWYNELRRQSADSTQLLDAPEDSLAFLLYSGPGFLNTIVERFEHSAQAGSCDFVDDTTDAILNELVGEISEDLHPKVLNLDKGPPYFHAQSLGVVAGVAQHLNPDEVNDPEWRESVSAQLLSTRSEEVWGSDLAVRQKLFGISIHPEFGGWYAYRGLVILCGARTSNLVRPPPVISVEDMSEKKRILEEYNLRGDDCLWRDLTRSGHAPDKRYTPEEMLFFTEMNLGRRKRFLEMKADLIRSSKGGAKVETQLPSFTEHAESKKWGANPELVTSLHRSPDA
eukprot:TRINITY_DN47738_c0_g1_i1.p1 TRINITY_DN47738_c0_g1~~TRINITY_DN47738_c0_g1_i1.p1  ORF type:complete len:319 (-),score=38.78 TRINITY_DN47738_c0_g1_i1:200-1156(-)